VALSKSLRKFINAEMQAADFHCEQSKLTRSEARFVGLAGQKMIAVHRPSWPDFLCMVDQQIVGVEVKAGADWFSDNQRRTFDILENSGALSIYVWDEWNPKKLIAWKRARTSDYLRHRRNLQDQAARKLEAKNASRESRAAESRQSGPQASPVYLVKRQQP
jgi:hypothetical protein